jgi:hypothetical protein
VTNPGGTARKNENWSLKNGNMSNDPSVTVCDRIPQDMGPYSNHQGRCRQPKRSNRAIAEQKEKPSSGIGQQLDCRRTQKVKNRKHQKSGWQPKRDAPKDLM